MFSFRRSENGKIPSSDLMHCLCADEKAGFEGNIFVAYYTFESKVIYPINVYSMSNGEGVSHSVGIGDDALTDEQLASGSASNFCDAALKAIEQSLKERGSFIDFQFLSAAGMAAKPNDWSIFHAKLDGFILMVPTKLAASSSLVVCSAGYDDPSLLSVCLRIGSGTIILTQLGAKAGKDILAFADALGKAGAGVSITKEAADAITIAALS